MQLPCQQWRVCHGVAQHIMYTIPTYKCWICKFKLLDAAAAADLINGVKSIYKVAYKTFFMNKCSFVQNFFKTFFSLQSFIHHQNISWISNTTTKVSTIQGRECVSTGAAGVWTHRSFGHHLLHRQILRLLVLLTLSFIEQTTPVDPNS